MSIFPATDIVTDVASAADPQKLKTAMKRLSDLSQGGPLNGAKFASVLEKQVSAHQTQPAAGSKAAPTLTQTTTAPFNIAMTGLRAAQTNAPAVEAAKKFEAFIIQSALEAMLPKGDNVSFGAGTAGGIWRSMMAEQLGTKIAKSGGLGIQKLVASHLPGMQKPPEKSGLS